MKLWATCSGIVYGLLITPFVYHLLQGRFDSRDAELALGLGAGSILLVVAFALPSLVWRWGEGASGFWAVGYCLLLFTIFSLAGPARSPSLGTGAIGAWLLVLAVSGSVMLLGFLARKNGVPRKQDQPAAGARIPLEPPSWLGDRLDLVYRGDTGDRTWFAVARTPQGARVRMKDETSFKRDAQVAEELRRDRDSFPAGWSKSDEDLLRGLEEEWFEFDLAESYGEFLIDLRRPLDRQPVWGNPAEYLGEESISALEGRYEAVGFRSPSESECNCVSVAEHVMVWIGPGRCWRCAGILSGLRHCTVCGGTGDCKSCLGDGKIRWDVRSWYERTTGVLLRRERWRNGTKEPDLHLESTGPDLTATFSRSDA